MLRRSRCISVLLVVVLVHIVIIFTISLISDSSLIIDELDLKWLLNVGVSYKSNRIFDELVDTRFKQTYDNKENLDQYNIDQLHLLDSFYNENNDEITLPDYLTDPDNNENPQIQRFDPRFTFGFLIHYLCDQISETNTVDDLKIPYFHWSDWVDLSILNEYYFKKEKETCQGLFDVTTSNLVRNKKLELVPPSEFCVDDDKIDILLENDNADIDSSTKELLKLVKQFPFSTGWHVFKYGGRSKKKLNILRSRSYLNDFMPPPLSVVFLLPNNLDGNKKLGKNGLRIRVNQDITNGRRKLINTELITNYIEKFTTINKDLLDSTKRISMNIKNELDQLTNLFIVHRPPLEESQISYTKELSHEQFIDKSKEILNDLENKQALSDNEVLYKESLKYSLETSVPPKYFFEAKIMKKESNWDLGGHYEWRFFNGLINNTDKQSPVLHGLLKAWLAFTNTYNVTTWIAHGTLLSWYWDGVEFPWDFDADVQMAIQDLHTLSKMFNQSIIVDLGNDNNQEIRYGRYFLDCGSFISHRTKGNGHNNIDARFIDIDTGLYIDITGLALSDTKSPVRYNELLVGEYSRNSKDETIGEFRRNEFLQAYNCRNNHFARLSELNPLRLTLLEGQPAYIPYGFEQLLVNEYRDEALLLETFKDYTFVPKLRNWIPTRDLKKFFRTHYGKENYEDIEDLSLKELSDDDFLALLFGQEDLLIEYLLTRNITQFHELERDKLFRKQSCQNMFLDNEGNLKVHFPPLRPDLFQYLISKEGYSFDDSIRDTLQQINTYKFPGPEPPQVFEGQNANGNNEILDTNDDQSLADPETGLPILHVEQQIDDNLDDISMNRPSIPTNG